MNITLTVQDLNPIELTHAKLGSIISAARQFPWNMCHDDMTQQYVICTYIYIYIHTISWFRPIETVVYLCVYIYILPSGSSTY